MKRQLSVDAWLDHGLRTLTASGVEGLKVERMAKALGVSRGSFYWHFLDLDDFKAALLVRWQTITTDRVIGDIEALPESGGRLEALMQRAYAVDDRLERAVRDWALRSEPVRAAVAAVDVLRVDYLRKLLREAGLKKADARRRALFLYWASLGRPAVGHGAYARMDEDDIAAFARLVQARADGKGHRR